MCILKVIHFQLPFHPWVRVSHFLIEIFCKNIIITKIVGCQAAGGRILWAVLRSGRVKVCTNCVHVRLWVAENVFITGWLSGSATLGHLSVWYQIIARLNIFSFSWPIRCEIFSVQYVGELNFSVLWALLLPSVLYLKGRFRSRCNCTFANSFLTPPFLTCSVENYMFDSRWKLIIVRNIRSPHKF